MTELQKEENVILDSINFYERYLAILKLQKEALVELETCTEEKRREKLLELLSSYDVQMRLLNTENEIKAKENMLSQWYERNTEMQKIKTEDNLAPRIEEALQESLTYIRDAKVPQEVRDRIKGLHIGFADDALSIDSRIFLLKSIEEINSMCRMNLNGKPKQKSKLIRVPS